MSVRRKLLSAAVHLHARLHKLARIGPHTFIRPIIRFASKRWRIYPSRLIAFPRNHFGEGHTLLYDLQNGESEQLRIAATNILRETFKISTLDR